MEVVEVVEEWRWWWRRRRRWRAGARRRIDPRLHRVVADRVVGVDRQRVARPARKRREGVARLRSARDQRAVLVAAVPGHADVVARGAPRELHRGLGHLNGGEARRLCGRRGVHAGAGRRALRGLAGAIAGGVKGVHRKRVARPAGEPGQGVRRPWRRASGYQALVDPVSDDADVVERPAPRERERRIGCGRNRKRRGARRRGRVRAGGRSRRQRRLRRAPAGLVRGIDLHEIAGSARKATERGGVGVDALHKAAVAIDPVLADAAHTSPLDSERVPARGGEHEPVRFARRRRRLAEQAHVGVERTHSVARDRHDPQHEGSLAGGLSDHLLPGIPVQGAASADLHQNEDRGMHIADRLHACGRGQMLEPYDDQVDVRGGCEPAGAAERARAEGAERCRIGLSPGGAG